MLREALLPAALALGATALVLAHRPPDGLVPIPGGTFIMGSPPGESGRAGDERPHPVSLRAFRLGPAPVTQAQWVAVMGRNPSYFRGSPELPVEGVTWYDAVAYCNLRSLQEGRKPAYAYAGAGTDPRRWPGGWKQAIHGRIAWEDTADGYRLPTEAEWEYACRAGTATATPYGNALASTQANFNGEAPYGAAERGPFLRRTTPVGSYPPNAWGLYDMLGDIGQWCWDGYGPYPASAVDPRGAENPSRRVHRGGAWFSRGEDLRSAARFADAPLFRLDMLPGGLRVARNGP